VSSRITPAIRAAVLCLAISVAGGAGGAGRTVWIHPGEDIQAQVDRHPAGTTFRILAGVHRMQQVRPKHGNSFIGEPGAVLSGARPLTAFAREGEYWVASGQTQRGQVHGRCMPGHGGCRYPEDLFIDDQALWQVTSLAELGPGRWLFDYGAGRIHLAEDPAGRTVETSVARYAFMGSARNVTIRGLTIEKYANPAQHGAIHGRDGTVGTLSAGWTVRDNVVRLNHGAGISAGHGAHVAGNTVTHNGQIGVTGTGRGLLIEHNEIAFNNRAGFDWGWEGGGTKFVRTEGLVVRGNHVHHNLGPGLWTDIDNLHTLYEGNLVEDNAHAGIFHEISYAARIRHNTVRRNGFSQGVWLWGAGILVAGSPDVEISENVVEDNANGIAAIQQDRGSGAHGPYVVENLRVLNNRVRMRTGNSGLAQDNGDRSVFTSRNNRFDHNHYDLGPNATHFHWADRWLDERGWRSYAQDVDGTFRRPR
jgi:hypothetical protein